MRIFDHTLRKHIPILVLALLVSAVGAFIFIGMPRSLFPEVNYPRVEVSVNLGYAPLQTMEWGVTSNLERTLRGVPGVRMVKSSTSRGLSMIAVYLYENQDVNVAVQLVNAKISETRSLLPASAQITVRPITAAAFPGAEYTFISKTKNGQELHDFVEYQLKPLVLGVPGVFDVKTAGGELPELSVQLDPTKLSRRNLSIIDIDDRLRNSNIVDFLGPIDRSSQEVLVFGGHFVQTPSKIESIVIDSSLGIPVTIADVGHVELTNAWKTKDVALNGVEGAFLDVYYQMGIDQKTASRSIADAVQKAVDATNGAYTFKSWDLNDFTDTATNAVLIDLAVGMFIIGLVTLLFLRSFRYSLVALLTMPLAAAFTFVSMRYLGLSINLMTLGGLTAAIGLVVDNVVIVTEMYHHKRMLNPAASTVSLLQETLATVARPMIYGTLTISLVFAPIGLLSGISGMFFAPMAIVAATALGISVLLALFIAPGLLLLLTKSKKAFASTEDKFASGFMSWLYQGFLHLGLRRPRLISLTLLILPLFGLASLWWAKTGFLPEWDEGDLVIDFRSVKPISLATTVEKIKPLENYLNGFPEVDFFVRKIGTGLGNYDKPYYYGEIVVKLKKDRKRTVFELRNSISGEASKLMPGFELDLFQILPDRIHDLSGSGKPIVLYLSGGDEAALAAAAATYKTALEKIQGLDSIRIEEPGNTEEAIYEINEAQSRAVELNPTAINTNARFGLFSLDSSSVQIGIQNVPIRLSMENKFKTQKLEDLPIYTTRGGLRRLGQIGKIDYVQSRVQATHVDGRPVMTLSAEIAGRDLGSVVADIKAMLAKNQISGIHVDLAGDYLTQQQSFKELMFAFLAGLTLIFLISLFFSESLRVAACVTACALIPPAVGLTGLVLLQIPLDVSSFSGLISVTGIAVSNSLMAISAISAASVSATSKANFRFEALVFGMKSRLRPILMTNLAAMAGFAPIAIGLATGDEILRPFSVAVIIGLFGALAATLMVMPLLYGAFCRQQPAI
jgi:multidrug efflux pump subunit AcrB